MTGRKGWSWRGAAVALTAAAVVTWLGAVVAADIRRAPDANCIAVDSSLMDVIASRPAADPVEPLEAVAVHDPWTRSKGSVPFDNYYAITMQFRRSDGSIDHGVWGLGSDSPLPVGPALTVVAGSAPLVSVDSSARQSTVWPDTEMSFPEDANSVKKSRQCLESVS
ncbi:hypothetical protein [Rhodococcus kronopolitis]|uniref:Uncharacterized protein n=1 Tax=Rhodococcus kronopolitis TaxID=1460226 RepID=A0ABV9FNV9_9NOCA